MKNSTRSREVAVAAVVAAVVAAILGIAAGRGNAAPVARFQWPGHAPTAEKSKHRKIKHGVLTVTGTKGDDKIALRLEAGRPDRLEVDLGDDGSADFRFNVKHIAKLEVDALSGDDAVRIDESNGVFTDTIATTIDGGGGNDTIAGGTGNETLLGGDGNDTIDGNGGDDAAPMGAGDDTFVWDPGDGSDTIEGGAGADTMIFNGANGAEKVDLSANGNRLKFTRDLAGITMDTAGVERVVFNALGGADLVTVHDLTGTDVSNVDVDLAATLGGATADGAADHVVVDGTNGNDAIDVSGDATAVKVGGLAATTRILHTEIADRLDLDTQDGIDTVQSAGLAAGVIQLFLDGVAIP